MRPLSTTEQGVGYDDTAMRAETVPERLDGDGEARPKKRRRVARLVQRGEVLVGIQEKVDRSYNRNTGSWSPPAARDEAKDSVAELGTPYERATRDLLGQTGSYCSYCDAPVLSDLRAQPTLSPLIFPQQAFDFANLLLSCAACANAAACADARGAGQPPQDAWPQRFATDAVGRTLLPYTFSLWRGSEGDKGFQPGQPGPLGPPETTELAFQWRLGTVREEGKHGLVQVFPDDKEEPYPIAALIAPTKPGGPIEPDVEARIENVEAMIEHFGLNRRDPGDHDSFVDRRVALRTLCFLRATDLLQRYRSTTDPVLRDSMMKGLQRVMAASGFWGVWLTVFKDVPNIQQTLRGLMPGTSPVDWAL